MLSIYGEPINMDFYSLTTVCLKEMRKHENEFTKQKCVEKKITCVKEKLEKNGLELAPIVRKWRKEPQFQTDFSKINCVLQKYL